MLEGENSVADAGAGGASADPQLLGDFRDGAFPEVAQQHGFALLIGKSCQCCAELRTDEECVSIVCVSAAVVVADPDAESRCRAASMLRIRSIARRRAMVRSQDRRSVRAGSHWPAGLLPAIPHWPAGERNASPAKARLARAEAFTASASVADTTRLLPAFGCPTIRPAKTQPVWADERCEGVRVRFGSHPDTLALRRRRVRRCTVRTRSAREQGFGLPRLGSAE
ncbi:hypothetical protein GCM10017712_26060 [Curtobacterium citreum]